MKTQIYIVGKNYSTSLGVIRGLGENGYRSTLIKPVRSRPKLKQPDEASCYLDSCVYTPDDSEETIIGTVRKLGNSSDADRIIVLPTDDACASLLEKNMEMLGEKYWVPSCCDTPGRLTEYMDKAVQKQAALKAHLKAAKGWTVDIVSGEYSVPENMSYPCFTKPQMSAFSPKTYIKKCSSEEELRAVLDKIAADGDNCVLIEEFISIEKEYVVPGVAFDECVVIPSIIEKLKIGEGAHKGVTMMGIMRKSSDYPELHSKLIEFMKSFHLRGLFDIEVLESGGEFYFNELNLRNGAATYADTACGVNLPGMLADAVINGTTDGWEQSEITEEHVFVSEKVCLENFKDGFSSYKEYRTRMKTGDVRFIRCDKDGAPYRQFRLIELKTAVKKLIK